VAPLMTKVMVYVMVRLMVTVFGLEYIFETLNLADAEVWLAVIAILAGAFTALFQKDLKKMLAYIIVCEIGYMVGGAWLGNSLGMTGAILHILNDGLMTFALFLAVGNIIYMRKQVAFSDLSGLFAAMPWTMAGWAPPMGIELRIDLLNAMVLVLISAIAFVNLVASVKNVEQEIPDRAPSFYVMYLLFVVGLLGVTATGDLFNLYVLIEITSMTSYALIALGDKDRAPLAALNYIFIGVIGASFYLLGVGYLYITTGSLNMADVAVILKGIQ
jgi:formate hydrogenlyase subunit 3/multisubunit Na+/H+ antiporter MnhD subunit